MARMINRSGSFIVLQSHLTVTKLVENFSPPGHKSAGLSSRTGYIILYLVLPFKINLVTERLLGMPLS